MKELELIVADLKNCLYTKEAELNNAIGQANTYAMSALNNRKVEVALFERSTREITTDPFEKNNILTNFTKGAAELKSAINKIEA
jgi:hypothetical protein